VQPGLQRVKVLVGVGPQMDVLVLVGSAVEVSGVLMLVGSAVEVSSEVKVGVTGTLHVNSKNTL
jgi:hypothetical protein